MVIRDGADSVVSTNPEPSTLMTNLIPRMASDDTVVIANDNTTVGYATFDAEARLLTYIFVHPSFRRRGYGRQLVEVAEKSAGRTLTPASPLSSSGRRFFGAVLSRGRVSLTSRLCEIDP